jgi:hypothetical protein
VRGCAVCQRCNPSNKAPPATLHPVPVKEIFHRWGVDLVGPLKETPRGNKYMAVATEYLTKWPEAVAIPEKSGVEVHRFLMSLTYRFGPSSVILHDQGREFNNHMVQDLCAQLKTHIAMTSAYHPQSNGYGLHYV